MLLLYLMFVMCSTMKKQFCFNSNFSQTCNFIRVDIVTHLFFLEITVIGTHHTISQLSDSVSAASFQITFLHLRRNYQAASTRIAHFTSMCSTALKDKVKLFQKLTTTYCINNITHYICKH